MNRNSFIVVSLLLFVATSIVSVIFYENWNEEKKHRMILQEEVKQLRDRLEASESNNKKLVQHGKEFIEIMFTYDSKTAPGIQEKLLERASGQARDKLTKSEEVHHTEGTEDIGGDISSKVEILETYYNRIDEDSALVTVVFNHVLTVEGVATRTKNEAVVNLEHFEGDWSIENFEVKQLL